MLKNFNKLLVSSLEQIQDAMPMIVIIIFYQMMILEVSVQEIMSMLGWMALITIGVILAL